MNIVFGGRYLLGLIAAVALAVSEAWCQCIIVPPPPDRPWPPPRPWRAPLSVRSEKVSVRIEDQVARTKIEQVFVNEADWRVEGTYVFPLPEEASISEFAMFVDGKRAAGEVLEAGKARRIYEEIVRKMRDPAILEYVGRNAFRAQMFPIPPRGEQKVELEYAQSLKADSNAYRYEFPLVVKEPGYGSPSPPPPPPRPIRPWDDRRGRNFSPALRPRPDAIGELVLQVEIESKVPIKGVYSPTHKVDADRKSDHRAVASFEGKDVVPDRSFVLYYTVSPEDFGLSLVSIKPSREDGYFMLLLAPKREIGEKEIADKNVVFVLDTSGSMDGEKIEEAKRSLKFCLHNLNREDRFDLITFSSTVRTFGDSLSEATKKTVDEAVQFVEEIKARGGTDIHGALTEALKRVKDRERPTMIVFITDGLPTVGETDEEGIVKDVTSSNRSHARLFAFGVGNDVNTHLLDKLTELNGGASDYLAPEEDLEVRISSFYEKVSYPVLSDLELDYGGAKVYDVFPSVLPDLFKGSQVTVFGRYDKPGEAKLTLRGKLRRRTERFETEVTFTGRGRGNEALPSLWAMRKIGSLLDAIRLKGDNRELRDETIKLSLEHGIMTPYTAFLIQEDKEVVALRPQITNSLKGGFGGGAGGGGLGGAQAREQAESVLVHHDTVGARANAGAVDLRRMKEAEALAIAAPGGVSVTSAAGKTFYLKDGVWVDGTYKAGTETFKVKYLSDAYFQLIFRNELLAKYLALGDKLIVCLENVVLEIAETGKEKLTPEELSRIPAA